LRRIPVDTLKIDRAFISHMDSDPESREIVRTIIMLAHNLGLKVVAEGAETEAHVNLLKLLSCEMAQGYFFSRPADDQAMSKLLAGKPSVSVASADSRSVSEQSSDWETSLTHHHPSTVRRTVT